MDWFLLGLAVFNFGSVVSMALPRLIRRRSMPWGQFFCALLATELAWIWLPLQLLIALILIVFGALDSYVGIGALLVLLLSWPGLIWSLWQSAKAGVVVEQALQAGLGEHYRQGIASEYTDKLRDKPRFIDWCLPYRATPAGIDVVRDVCYGSASVRQKMDIYRPLVLPKEGCPVVLQIHGGGFVAGDKAQQARPLLHLLASRGWICVSINYRLSPEVKFPSHLYDCKAALCWIRQHGSEYGMDASFVAVTGGSAGGSLAALMGLTENRSELQPGSEGIDTSVQACIPFYGAHDLLARFGQHKSQEMYTSLLAHTVLDKPVCEAPELWDMLSPISHLHQSAPPFMVVQGGLDSLVVVDEGREFSRRLNQVSPKPMVYVELPGAEHAFDSFHSPRTEQVADGMHRFLEVLRSSHKK